MIAIMREILIPTKGTLIISTNQNEKKRPEIYFQMDFLQVDSGENFSVGGENFAPGTTTSIRGLCTKEIK